MKNIKQLDNLLANMIAAGEVVDRPAAVLKELVENSIDAGSTKIVCEIEEAGIKLIKVTDNGVGILSSELGLALTRHATSKVSKASDLNKINTLGFRGEALPSIGSVSKIKISSKVKDADGRFVYYEKNQLIEEGNTAINTGTEVTVTNLFYETPARFKYLKSEYTERNLIIETFDKLALSKPEISFELIIDSKQVRKTYGNNNVNQVVESILGKGISHKLVSFSGEFSHIKINGYISKPDLTRSNRKQMHLYINNRSINNYYLQKAIIDGYNTLIMKNRFPVSIIYIDIDPSLVDVNIHPQKQQVRLANERQLSYQLEELVRKTLLNKPNNAPIDTKPKLVAETLQASFNDDFIQQSLELFDDINKTNIVSFEPLPHFNYVAQIQNTYLMFTNEKGLYFIDQHAADERIRFEYYKDSTTKNSVSKPLLVEYVLDLTNQEIAILNNTNNKKMITNLGFEFDNNKVYAHPSWLRLTEIDQAFNEIIYKLESENNLIIEAKDLALQLSKDISCKAAIKANHRLSSKEVNYLIEQLRLAENPYSCPHGRPIMIHISFYEIEKWFKRVV